MKIWFCKIGEAESVPEGADGPMREAVEAAYKDLTGREPGFLFSGWGGQLSEAERAAHENRLPNPPQSVKIGPLEFVWDGQGCEVIAGGRAIEYIDFADHEMGDGEWEFFSVAATQIQEVPA